MNRSEILENIRDQIGAENLFEGNLFEEEECSADLTGVSEDDRVVMDLDKVFPGGRWRQKQCECVLFYFDDAANFVVIPIELKGGKNAEAEKAVEQLEGGLPMLLTTHQSVLSTSAILSYFIVVLARQRSDSSKETNPR